MEPTERRTTEGRTGFKITIPLLGGTKIEATGKDVFITAIIVGITVALVVLYDHKEATAKEHTNLADRVNVMADHLSEQTYVLTLPQEKREALNLQMPDTLRKKIRQQHLP